MIKKGGPDNDNFPKITDIRTRKALDERNVSEMRQMHRQSAIQGIRAIGIRGEERPRYQLGPFVARDVLLRMGKWENIRSDVNAMLPTLANLRAVELAALMQMVRNNEGTDADPAFSVALAEAYFQARDHLIKTILAMEKMGDANTFRKITERYRRIKYNAVLELELMFQSESPEHNMGHVTAIAAVLKERAGKDY